MLLLMMSETPPRPHVGRRRFASLREHLLAEIDALAFELEEAAEVTDSGKVKRMHGRNRHDDIADGSKLYDENASNRTLRDIGVH